MKGILITWINPNKRIELHEDYKKDLAYLPAAAAAAAAATAAAASTRSGVLFAGSNVATSPNPSPAATSPARVSSMTQ
jgi:hypothetical protein